MITHWIPPFTRRRPNRTQEAFCGAFVTEKEYSTEPTCPACKDAMEADARELEDVINEPSDPSTRVAPPPDRDDSPFPRRTR